MINQLKNEAEQNTIDNIRKPISRFENLEGAIYTPQFLINLEEFEHLLIMTIFLRVGKPKKFWYILVV